MRVGVISTGSIPFVIRNGEKYSGIAIEIWEKIAKNLNIKFEYVELKNDKDLAIQKIKSRDIDILVGPYNITEKRYKDVNFTIPFYMTNFCFASVKKMIIYKTILTFQNIYYIFLSSFYLYFLLIIFLEI